MNSNFEFNPFRPIKESELGIMHYLCD